MKYSVRFFLLIGFLLLYSADQTSYSSVRNSDDTPMFSLQLVINENNLKSYGMTFGIHPDATKGIDLSLGEKEYPPFPPGGGMSMFRTVDGNAILDLRSYESPTQADTYLICIALDESDYVLFPMTFSWPNLSSYYSGSVRLISNIEDISIDIDMKAQTSYSRISYPGYPEMKIWYLYIIAAGPLPGTSLPVVSTYGLASGGFQGIVHAPAGGTALANSAFTGTAGTTTWFEYGPTKLYGTSTTPQIIADGTSMNISSPFDPRTLPPDTRIHFRAVAQTNSGTFYGEDQIISRGNPPAEVVEDTTKYITARMWLWTIAQDEKNRKKAVKCKPNSVAFKFNLVVKSDSLEVIFPMPTTGTLYLDKSKTDPYLEWSYTERLSVQFYQPTTVGDTIRFEGFGSKGRLLTVEYKWWEFVDNKWNIVGMGKLAPGKVPLDPKDTIEQNQLILPMPNLHNIGEQIFGGVSQTPVSIVVGNPSGAHSVAHPKYKDVQKSLFKDIKWVHWIHNKPPRCLDVFDKNNNEIKRQQKSLPFDKHNNRLFAEQLTLRLNIAASDSGIFPPGFGDLLFDEGIQSPFNGLTVRQIADSVDRYLGCNGSVAGTIDPSEFLRVDSLLNESFPFPNYRFPNPFDTVSWSCEKMVCKGVRMLKDVPYLHANPAASPKIDFSRRRYTPNEQIPSVFGVSQNYPNPFNPTTTIGFTLAQDAIVTLKVYNMLGQEIQTLLNNELMEEGEQYFEFNASGLPSGVYFYKITAQSENNQQFNVIKRMVLLK